MKHYIYDYSSQSSLTSGTYGSWYEQGVFNIRLTYDYLKTHGLYKQYERSFSGLAMKAKFYFYSKGDYKSAYRHFPFVHRKPGNFPFQGIVKYAYWLAFNLGIPGMKLLDKVRKI